MGGGPTTTHKFRIGSGSQTADPGRTSRQTLFVMENNTINTQGATEAIGEVGNMILFPPIINIGTGDTISLIYNVLIQGVPSGTAAESYGLYVRDNALPTAGSLVRIGSGQNGVKLLVAGSGGSTTLADTAQTRFSGDYGSGASATSSQIFDLDGRLLGDGSNTLFLNGSTFRSRMFTTALTISIANISQVQIDEPDITDNLGGGGLITNAQSLLITGSPTEGVSNFSIRSLGTAPVQFAGSMIAQGASGHAFGAPAINSVLTIDTTSTANGGGTSAFAVNFFPDYTGASGLTSAIALMNLGGNIQTQATDTIANVSTLVVADPAITVGGGATVTNAQSLLISGAPTEGTNNYAQRILGGNLQIANASEFLFRNASDSADLTALSMGASNFLEIAGAGSAEFEQVNIYSLGGVVLFTTDDARVQTDAGTAFTVRSANGSVRFFQVGPTQTKAIGQLVVAASIVNNQAETQIQSTFADVATSAGSSVTAASLIPAGSFLIGVTVRVLVTVTGPTGFDVGDGTDVDRWGASIAVAATTTTDITDFNSGAVTTFPLANDVVLTSDGVDFTGGSVRITVHYMTLQTSAA